MEKEYLDVYNGEEEKVDIKSREDNHRYGLLHKAVHCYIIDLNKKLVLLQKRSKSKDSYPGCFDISCCGHVSTGLSEEESMIKELKEELGLDVKVDELELIAKERFYNKSIWHDEDFVDNEINYIYALFVDNLDINNLKLQEEELEEVRWYKFSEVTEDNSVFVMNFNVYKKVLHYVNMKIKNRNCNSSRSINRIKLFSNDNRESSKATKLLTEKLLENKFEIVEDNPELCVAIGGDGSFLRMIKACNYSSEVVYVGINAGTLGFLQEIRIEDIDMFILSLNADSYKIENIGIQETEIITETETHHYYALNEILIREKDLNTALLDVMVDNAPLEKFVGDGLLIATSVGSTAYNMSFGGSIVYNTLHTLQITPVAPLNSKAYRNLLNSLIIPENIVIEIIPKRSKSSLLLSIDGENKLFDNIKRIKTVVGNKRIRCLRLENYNFFEKINDKFLN